MATDFTNGVHESTLLMQAAGGAMRTIALLGTILLIGCAGHSRFEPPVVDMNGVDADKYNADVAACTKAKQEGPYYGNPTFITDCMALRGYRILETKG